MPKNTTDHAIRTRIDSFLAELGALVKNSALEAVQDALGEGAPRRRGPGRPKGSGRRGPGRPRKVGRRPGRPARAGKRIRRSAADLEKIAARVLAHVRSNAGHRLEQIGKALKTETAILKRPIANLLAARKLRTKGQRRGTMYFAGGRGKAAKAKARVRRPVKRARKAKVTVHRPAKRTRRSSRKRAARRAAPRIVVRAQAPRKKSARKLPRKAPISRARAVVNELAMDAAAMSAALQ
jgi:hypothetical protein